MSDNLPRIVLGMPGYGRPTIGAMRGFYHACRDMEPVTKYYQAGSLLASNFNQLWCLALNLAHRGERVDYFAMLHDDVDPEEFWLDKLIAELEAKKLDVLSVAVPIKDSRGMTSMALHRDRDNWMPLARLSMHDVYALPETFTSDDIGEPLLLNTGCWVAKWNQDWCRTVHFEINDRIVFNKAQGRYQAQTEPEDWHFSRMLHEIGRGPTSDVEPLRIGATRKVKVMHRGEVDFTNEKPWGTHRWDMEATDKSPVPNAHPYDVIGWLLPDEGKELARLAAGKRVLEIGSYNGLSTICMARTAEHVTACDYFDGRGTAVPNNCLPTFRSNIARHALQHKVTTCHPDDELPFDEYDLVFIDGAHDLDSVRADIQKALSVVKPDGLIVFHDYKSGIDLGVDLAVDEFLESGAELVSKIETLAVVKPPASIPLEV